MTRRVTILGSTGSIGQNTLNVIEQNAGEYEVFALGANTQVDKLFEQCIRHQPKIAVMADHASANTLHQKLKAAGQTTEILIGTQGLVDIASQDEVDIVMSAIVGAAGLLPTLAAIRANKRVLLSNKESLVMSGDVFIETLKNSSAELIPVDSEHSAILQCMPAGFRAGRDIPNAVTQITLTASGGPFRSIPLEQLTNVTPAQAVAHPTWRMGAKISVDSATMINKGLEVIETHYLFQMPIEKIDVVIHPQSIVHSLVNYRDGSMLAQLGRHDMRTPIACALAWPDRIESGVPALDLLELSKLEFYEVDFQRYPCLSLVYSAISAGGTAPALLNAANEVAVEAFLNRRIQFTQIATTIEHVLNTVASERAVSLESILSADSRARDCAVQKITSFSAAIA